ncbi:MAG: DUF5722 domain-containing protein [Oribacterium sp.]|nr:DUF5722 domain-containing protein [Oribacterium sp.]
MHLKFTGRKLLLSFAALMMLTCGGTITAFAHNLTAAIQSVTIDTATKSKININVSTNGDSTGTDGKLYIFEIKPYQSDLSGRSDPIASAPIAGNMDFSASLLAGPGEKRIYSAFTAAVKENGKYQMVGSRHYITNPEVLATNTDPALNPGKKGLRIENYLADDAISMNIKHAGLDLATEHFFGKGIWYYYEGKNYQINADMISYIDQSVKKLSDNGVAVTLVLLNSWNPAYPELYRPGVTQQAGNVALYYDFNVETESGYRAIKAMASFLAKRYNGKNGYGKVTNWVIGNEINNQYWNYAGISDITTYVRMYQRAFRVFYTAMKSESANDNVMFSLDLYWNMLPESGIFGKYKARDVLDTFNNIDIEEGRIDWGLALHPYPYPLVSPNFWDDLTTNQGKVTTDVNSPIVTFANLNVITDYMQNAGMLDTHGKVRHIFLTEQGFTSVSGQGQDVSQEQAAAVAYAYYIVYNNPYIDAMLLTRQIDVAAGDGMSDGLEYVGKDANGQEVMIHKPARDVFANIDNPALTQQTSEFAKAVVGITDWSQVIPGFRYPGQ